MYCRLRVFGDKTIIAAGISTINTFLFGGLNYLFATVQYTTVQYTLQERLQTCWWATVRLFNSITRRESEAGKRRRNHSKCDWKRGQRSKRNHNLEKNVYSCPLLIITHGPSILTINSCSHPSPTLSQCEYSQMAQKEKRKQAKMAQHLSRGLQEYEQATVTAILGDYDAEDKAVLVGSAAKRLQVITKALEVGDANARANTDAIAAIKDYRRFCMKATGHAKNAEKAFDDGYLAKSVELCDRAKVAFNCAQTCLDRALVALDNGPGGKGASEDDEERASKGVGPRWKVPTQFGKDDAK